MSAGTTVSAHGITTPADSAGQRPTELAWLYVVGGAIGLVASLALTLEKLETLANPDYVPTCSVNPIISCGSVMESWQAGLFGFPNPLIGIAAFPVVTTAGVALLARFTAPRWFWLGMQLATTIAVVFIHWLIFHSLYTIGALCPYCMIVWAVVIPIFWYTTVHNLRVGNLGGGRAVGATLARFHSLALTLWFLLVIVLILQRFWDYWVTLV